MSVDELSERLEECSKTQQDIIDAGYGPPDETLGPLIFRNNFYLEPGKLILWFGGVDKKIIIDVNDIQEFLKVPAW